MDTSINQTMQSLAFTNEEDRIFFLISILLDAQLFLPNQETFLRQEQVKMQPTTCVCA